MSHLQKVKQKRRRKKITLLSFVFGLLLILGYVSLDFIHKERNMSSENVLSGSARKITPTQTVTSPISPRENASASLSAVINQVLEKKEGTYSIAVENLKTGETYFLNEHRTYQSGSLYKLWVMAAVYSQIENNALKKSDILSQNISVLNSKFYISPEDAEQTEGTLTLSVSDALNSMITVSDNYAALLLSEKIGLSRVASFLKSNGFTESSVGTNGDAPATTASDIALFLKKTYQGKLADKDHTDEMINLLKGQKLNNKIPKYLPGDQVIAHKTGEIYGFSHDAGIIYTDNGDYILVLLSESDDPAAAEESLADISFGIYTYFSKQTL